MTTLNTRPYLTSELPSLKRWTVRDYHRMSDCGILDPTERTELIDGQITVKIAKGTPHVTSLCLLANELQNRFDSTVLIRTQDPILLDDFSEPEPDLVVARGTILDYSETHPRPEDIYLIVEVADSTLKTDCEIKDKLYARAGISDYWVLDVRNRQLHIFREPTPTGYTRHLIVSEPNRVAPLAFSQSDIALSEILPPLA